MDLATPLTYVKGIGPARSALHTTLIGGLAATAAFVIARMFSGEH